MEQIHIEKIEFKKVRDFGEKLNATIAFFRQNFKKLGRALLIIIVPGAVLSAILSNAYQSIMVKTLKSGGFLNFNFPSEAYPVLLGMIAIGLLQVSLIYAIVYEYIILYIDKGVDVDTKEVWQKAKKGFLKTLGGLFIGYILIVLGVFLLLIPGIYLTMPVALTFIIMFREQTGFFTALGRSLKLIRGKWWSTFGLLLITTIIMVLIGYLFSIPFYLFSGASMFSSLSSGEEASSFNQIMKILASIVYNLVVFVLYSIPLIALAFQYFNLVERKESAGLMDKINTMGGEKKNEGTY